MDFLVRMLQISQLLVLSCLPVASSTGIDARPTRIPLAARQVLSADAFLAAARELVDSDPISPLASALLNEASSLAFSATAIPNPTTTAVVVTSPTTPTTTGAAQGAMDNTPIPLGSAIPGTAEIPLGAANQTDGGSSEVRDPANGAFPGGVPKPVPDVPITVIFLLLFILGAFTHISIYRANSKRGHKFLLSDLMFDFCMIRNLTCIFRIIWAFVSPRGVILVALIFENGGAAVIFAVNLFFAQRIFRAMHPTIGWSPPFTVFTLFLIWSVPSVIIINIISISVSFFSVGKETQLASTEKALTFGASWNVMLSLMPLLLLLIAGLLPMKKKPEHFGSGTLPGKVALVAYASATLGVGAAIRAAAIINPEQPDTQSILFGKPVFYTTGFVLEILVVALYAVARIDLLFHIPNGSSKPGDYTAGQKTERQRNLASLQSDIEKQLESLGVSFETISPAILVDEQNQFVVAKLTFAKGKDPKLMTDSDDDSDETRDEPAPPRPKRAPGRSPFEVASPASTRPASRTWSMDSDVPNMPYAIQEPQEQQYRESKTWYQTR